MVAKVVTAVAEGVEAGERGASGRSPPLENTALAADRFRDRFRVVVNFCFSFSAVVALLGFLSSGLRFMDSRGIQIISGVGWKLAGTVAIGIVLLQLAGVWNALERRLGLQRDARANRFELCFFTEAALLGLFILLASDFVTRRFIFYIDSAVRADVIVTGGVALGIMYLCRSAGLTPVLTIRLNRWMLLFSQLIIAALFLKLADNRLIFSDDHPSFLYRLQLLKEHFPDIPFFNTDWNAGYSAREFFAVGVLSVYLLAWPLLQLFDINSFEGAVVYTYLIPYLYVLILPWSTYLGARLMRLPKDTALLAALLSLGPSIGFFEWLLKYGTIGFALSCGLVPLTLALCLRLTLDEEPPRWWVAPALIVVSFCCLAWTLNFLAFLPAVIVTLIFFRHSFSRDRLPYVAAFALLYLLVNATWILTFVNESRVGAFLSRDTLPGSNTRNVFGGKILPPDDEDEIKVDEVRAAMNSELPTTVPRPEPTRGRENKLFSNRLYKAKEYFQAALVRVNPLILLFSLPGMFIFPQRRVRLALIVTVCWLLFVGAFGDLFKPQLELRRMVITASFILTVIAAPAIQGCCERLLHIFRRGTRNGVLRNLGRRVLAGLALIILFGAIIVSPITVGAVYSNRSSERFVFAPPLFREFSEAIRRHGGDGRTFFLGFILHDFGASNGWIQDGGHVAPIATFSGKELFAFEFFHSRWSAHDPIPEEFRLQGDVGVEAFLDLMNVTAVVAFTPQWTQYARMNPQKYRPVFSKERFSLFERRAPSDGYFLIGRGKIQRINRYLIVTPETDEVVIKYRYLRRHEFQPADIVEGYRVPVYMENKVHEGPEFVDFIGLRSRPGKSIRNVPIKIAFDTQ